ncbi:cellulose-binding domain-containing protein [Amycolatopsis sp., V23-08]|uniref:Cellulose-binding domain-containing protein n=1 Tax=Amycolatopsis heterodermiae TaxID=3110235 RepID=A0ABU5RHF5_9PSEU|nr:cellulose-binding domain-containing protein [Amycolatopsis sp., V23-08]MEA5365044.1 cellulose-binding domain-containing protein [Amycolatopsis sp., V23-08]
MKRFAAALAGLCLAAAGTTAVLAAGPAAAAPACGVDYHVDQWATGFTAQVTVTNGATALASWTLSWHYAGTQVVTSGWNATVRQSGTAVTAESLPYNASLPAGGTVTFGLQGTYSGSNPAPGDFALNGVSCGGEAPPTTTTSSPPPAGCADVCDDFEQQTGTTPGGRWTIGAANCTGTGTVSVDSTVAHSGTRSVKVTGQGGYCNHAFLGTPLATGTVRYGRLWVRHTTPLPAGHVTFLALKDSADGGRDLRAGGQNRALQWNRESDDATLPAQSPAGVALSVPLPTGTWSCFEFGIDGPAGQLRTWLNGTEVPGLVVDGVPTPDVDQQWLARAWHPSLTDLRLGWESYGTDADTLWFDDVATGPARIGC